MEVKSKYFQSSTETMDKHILAYLKQLEPPADIELPGNNIQWLYPLKDPETRRCLETFYGKYYSDPQQRVLVFGINPGRFGGGTTGIPFADPIRLKQFCNIDTSFPPKPELSSAFIFDHFFDQYPMEEFYKHFFIGCVCPLGLELNNKNMNYYDDKVLMNHLLEDFIPVNIQKQIDLGCSKKIAICLGEGQNYTVLNKINKKYHFFEDILKLSHPRYIMQYKRKSIQDYIKNYIDTCQMAQKILLN